MYSIPSGHPLYSEAMFPCKQISKGMMMMMVISKATDTDRNRTQWEQIRRQEADKEAGNKITKEEEDKELGGRIAGFCTIKSILILPDDDISVFGITS